MASGTIRMIFAHASAGCLRTQVIGAAAVPADYASAIAGIMSPSFSLLLSGGLACVTALALLLGGTV